jgi:hypothetical protein
MSPSERIKHLLSFRFATEASEREARDLWRDIVEGRSDLWSGIPADRKETIRGLFFLRMIMLFPSYIIVLQVSLYTLMVKS